MLRGTILPIPVPRVQAGPGYDPVHLPVLLKAHTSLVEMRDYLLWKESEQSPVLAQLPVAHHLGVTLCTICVPGKN